jgi:hypothetical protein
MDAFFEWAKGEYPSHEWQKLERSMRGLDDAGCFFNSVKFYFSPHGSGISNNLFMQPGGVVCEVIGSLKMVLFSGMSRMFGLFHVAARLAHLTHYCRSIYCLREAVLPLEVGQRMIRAGMEFIETGIAPG